MNSTAKAADRNVQTQTAKIIPFRNAKLMLVSHEGQPFVPMKPVVEGMGLAWQAQHAKLSSGRFNSTITEIVIVAEDGKKREMTCLPLRKLTGWLMSIHPNKVRPELRDGIIAYQNECDDALWAYWNEGEAVNPRKARKTKALPNGLTEEQQDSIKALVKARAECLPKDKRAKATITCWSALKSKFGCSYKEISPEHFTDALSLVARIVLEGELLEAEAPRPLGQLEIDFTVAKWIASDPNGFRLASLSRDDRIGLPIRVVSSMDSKSPIYELLQMLEDAGYQIEACKLELMALKDHVDVMHGVMGNLQRALENTMQRSILWNCRTKRSAV
ncbi:hypothetical protein FXN65_10830 [Metapseudomonas lalkuanensis]|uniref:Antirepressor protein ant N-terminal domain-containing protein n=1 Tax=Metapseudomonas lalkuanensis TaxID=2604832 RepID=A0A5J6QJ53_9GAMM|nr:phage antirepressor N-terminal domain-containing protein [Pseudomonas lalkuanensis]QEY62544.1 hypothetical protein FXN65_10830 [Pseudomonas lalkuanensis]